MLSPQENIVMANIQSKNSYDNDDDLLLLELLFSLLLLAFVLTIRKILARAYEAFKVALLESGISKSSVLYLVFLNTYEKQFCYMLWVYYMV